MAIVNTQRGFVFLANPHTASRAMATALLKIKGSVEAAHHHATLPTVIQECPAASSCSIVFQIVRHPLDWLVSRYLCNGGDRDPWKLWLRKRPPRDIFGRFYGQTTIYAKYEMLFPMVTRIIGCEIDLQYDPEHQSPGKRDNYMSYWDREDIAWARSRFANDFERYNYHV